MQAPRAALQVSAERMSAFSMPRLSISAAFSSVISSLRLTMASPVMGLRMSSWETRPTMRSLRGTITSPISMMAPTSTPSSVPQSSWVMIMSWATSTRRRVR